MQEPGVPSLWRLLIIIVLALFCCWTLGQAYFSYVMDDLVVRPLRDIGGWIGSIPVQDKGGDVTVTLPPMQDDQR